MAIDRSLVTHICDQMKAAGAIRARAMFGGYGVYCNDRLVGLICYDQLFLRPLPEAIALLPDATMVPPYTGAKPYILADAVLDDPELLAKTVATIADLVPPPKPKKPKRPQKDA